jgi:hypothetical protein
MAEIVNLRQRRKAAARADARTAADANAAMHGRTKGQKARETAEAQRASETLDGAKRERPDEG